MTYRTLMVGLDASPTRFARTDLAIALARDFDAHLIGVAPTGLVDLPSAPEAAAVLGDDAATAWELLVEQAQSAATEFHQRCKTAGLRSFEALVDRAPHAPSFITHAHCADLLVMSQPDPAHSGHRQDRAVLEQVLMHSARPTLVAPYVQRGALGMDRILVGWDESREAVRAMTDALPLLRRAAAVNLVHWHHGGEAVHVRQQMHGLRQWLAFQGVDVREQVSSTSASVGEAMLSAACDSEVDLIVMGAYGHPRWSEHLFGGTSRTLLDAMTVPVLMAH
ncbi:MAG: universal stress protein [Mitsuaria chitosanitabida]|uniref:universal stress protein n=1 Tax=Roseateles chitosanitabidus TaxID=65048 RepID=UPI001B17A585|nr:universal stress protein [Roseateles chitosanitabidus]MBO9685681.1 universal stress protein [Roseateles chitosanitabidus]